jgi:hypothetical protein
VKWKRYEKLWKSHGFPKRKIQDLLVIWWPWRRFFSKQHGNLVPRFIGVKTWFQVSNTQRLRWITNPQSLVIMLVKQSYKPPILW